MSNRTKGKGRALLASGFLVIGAVAAYYFYSDANTEAPENEALLATVEIGSIENTIAAAGSLKPSNYVDVGAQVSGQLQRLYVEIGELVTEGQLLAEIDARVAQARVEASRASIEALEAQLNAREAALVLARSNLERQSRLVVTDVTSQFEVDTARNALASAESGLIQLQKQIEQSEASLETEETQLEFTRIYAPMTGTVVAIEMEEGRTLNAVQQAPIIMRIADLGTMTVGAEVSEADIGDIQAGMDVYFTTLGGRQRRWYSQVRQILPTPVVENNVVLYTGLFDIENSDGSLLPEMTAQVYFITASAQDVLTVPMGALSFPERQGRPRREGSPTLDQTQAPATRPSNTQQANEPQRRLQAQTIDSDASPLNVERAQAGFRQGGETPARQRPAGRPALVTVVDESGEQREQRIRIGVSSRISAEVLEGLQVGDRVVAGIMQNQRPGQDQNSTQRRFRPPGGF